MPRAAFLQPMVATLVDALPEGDGWAYEVKLDGYRALVLKDDDTVQIRSRNNKDLTRTYPGVASAASRLRAASVVLDGEIVAVDLWCDISNVKANHGSSVIGSHSEPGT